MENEIESSSKSNIMIDIGSDINQYDDGTSQTGSSEMRTDERNGETENDDHRESETHTQ